MTTHGDCRASFRAIRRKSPEILISSHSQFEFREQVSKVSNLKGTFLLQGHFTLEPKLMHIQKVSTGVMGCRPPPCQGGAWLHFFIQ